MAFPEILVGNTKSINQSINHSWIYIAHKRKASKAYVSTITHVWAKLCNFHFMFSSKNRPNHRKSRIR